MLDLKSTGSVTRKGDKFEMKETNMIISDPGGAGDLQEELASFSDCTRA